MSRESQTKRLVAVQIWVLSTAREVILPAARGDPPLKPVHPIHKKPAPANICSILLGGKCCLSCEFLGPTYTYIINYEQINLALHLKIKTTNITFVLIKASLYMCVKCVKRVIRDPGRISNRSRKNVCTSTIYSKKHSSSNLIIR